MCQGLLRFPGDPIISPYCSVREWTMACSVDQRERKYIYIAKQSWFALGNVGSSTAFVIPEAQVVVPAVVAPLRSPRESQVHRNVTYGLPGSTFCKRI